VTPLLEGIDLDDEGERRSLVEPVLVASDESFIVIALNSANYCGVVEGLEGLDERDLDRIDELAKHEPVLRRLQEELRYLRIADVARLSPVQLRAVGDVLTQIRLRLSPESDRPIQIVALHHQLLPVSATEEVKPYESITNLGEVREFLRSNEVDIVLHGHKHVDNLYWDHHYGDQIDQVPLEANIGRPILISSCGTIGAAVGDETAKLIEIPGRRPGRPRRRTIRISSIRSIGAGAQIPNRLRVTDVRLSQQPVTFSATPATLLQGETTSDVYAQVLERFEDIERGDRIERLFCYIADGRSGLKLPQGYPELPGQPDLDSWLHETVRWWQKPRSNLRSLRYTHGERIHRYAQAIDQLNECIGVLRDDPTTGRAIISLFDPRFDPVRDKRIKFPSFCNLQFTVGRLRTLDCVAYFRVQEMKYWWPVNMAEIAGLQQSVIDRLWAERINLRPGSILTVGAIALWEDSPPRVLVPLVDRMSEDDRHRLRSMACALYQPDMPNRQESLSDWKRIFTDWLPAEQLDRSGAPVPVDGLMALKNEMEWFEIQSPRRGGDRVIRILTQMIADNENYLASQGTADIGHFEAHAQWRTNTLSNVQLLHDTIEGMR
jgi:hypothetical protein